MVWTREAPKGDSGWYWFYGFVEGGWMGPTILWCWDGGYESLVTDHPDTGMKVETRYLDAYWLGPIPVPDLPIEIA